MNRLLILTTLFAIALLSGCKKEEISPAITDAPPTVKSTAAPAAGAPGHTAPGGAPGGVAPAVGQ